MDLLGSGLIWYGVPSPIMIIDKKYLLSSNTPGRFPKRPRQIFKGKEKSTLFIFFFMIGYISRFAYIKYSSPRIVHDRWLNRALWGPTSYDEQSTNHHNFTTEPVLLHISNMCEIANPLAFT